MTRNPKAEGRNPKEVRSPKSEARKAKWVILALLAVAFALILPGFFTGCATMDRAYDRQVTYAEVPTVHTFTNTVVVTNQVPVVVERTNVVYVTNPDTGSVFGVMQREAVVTNFVTMTVTNLVPVYYTNMVQAPVTNLVDKPAAEAGIGALGSIINTFAPGIGSIVALALGGLYHGYRQVRNKKVNEALVQGVETARAVLKTTPQGQAADAEFVRWLMENQKAAGVFAVVSGLVDSCVDNPAAKLTAQEIRERLERAQQQAQKS